MASVVGVHGDPRRSTVGRLRHARGVQAALCVCSARPPRQTVEENMKYALKDVTG